MWGFALIGGPLLLFLALLWARMRASKREGQVDHVRSKSDPSYGMEGAGVSPDTVKDKTPRS